jgi:hypothetical protein
MSSDEEALRRLFREELEAGLKMYGRQPPAEEDQLLMAEEAAALLKVSEGWP